MTPLLYKSYEEDFYQVSSGISAEHCNFKHFDIKCHHYISLHFGTHLGQTKDEHSREEA